MKIYKKPQISYTFFNVHDTILNISSAYYMDNEGTYKQSWISVNILK